MSAGIVGTPTCGAAHQSSADHIRSFCVRRECKAINAAFSHLFLMELQWTRRWYCGQAATKLRGELTKSSKRPSASVMCSHPSPFYNALEQQNACGIRRTEANRAMHLEKFIALLDDAAVG